MMRRLVFDASVRPRVSMKYLKSYQCQGAGYKAALEAIHLFPGSEAQLGSVFLSTVRPTCVTFDLIIRHVLATARDASRIALEREYLTDYRPIEDVLISSSEHGAKDYEALLPRIAEDLEERVSDFRRLAVDDEDDDDLGLDAGVHAVAGDGVRLLCALLAVPTCVIGLFSANQRCSDANCTLSQSVSAQSLRFMVGCVRMQMLM
jgi:hypothetical protein